MRFMVAVNLLGVILIPFVIAFLVWRERARQKALRLIGDVDLISNLFPPGIFARRVWKSVLWLVAWVSLFVALARPVWGIDIDVVETRGVSVMFVLDVSSSMNAADVLPSRLERAKLSLQEMIRGLAGNEMGVILFAGTAFVQFPLTTDTTSAKTFLKAVSSSSISRQGTDIGAALNLAIDSFPKAQSTKRFIVLMTDGENLQDDPLSAVSQARQQGITIYTIGYGEIQRVPIPVRDENGQITGYKSDQGGNLVLSSLDEVALREIAEKAEGNYQYASPNGEEAQQLIDMINQTESVTLDRSVQSHDVERFEIFVVLALLALTTEIFIPEVSRRAA